MTGKGAGRAKPRPKERISPEERRLAEAEIRYQTAIAEMQVYRMELEAQYEELRLAQAEAIELRAKYQDLFDDAPFGYFILDREGLITEVNQQGAAFLKTARSALLGRKFALFISRIDLDLYLDSIRRIMDGEGKQNCELRLVCGGQLRHFYLEVAQISLPHEGAGGIRLVLLEDTARHEAVQAMHAAHRELEQRVADRTAELAGSVNGLRKEVTKRKRVEAALRDEMTEKLEVMARMRVQDRMLMQQGRHAAMGQMVGNIAHQWRQPLNVLGLLLQELQLRAGLQALTPEKLDENVNKAMALLKHMSTTIDDFREFFSPDRERSDFSVAEQVERTAGLIRALMENQRIRLTIDTAANPMVCGYVNEFSQVIMNLLANAREALGKTLPAAPEIVVSIRTRHSFAIVTVTDNAGGIPEEILPSIFDPYFTTKAQGTGLGLFMCKTIIEKHMHGTLTAENIASGARFTMTIPLAPCP